MARSVLVDAGFLVAMLSRRDSHHKWVVQVASDNPPPWYTCEGVLSEAHHLLGERGAPGLNAMLLRSRSREVQFGRQRGGSGGVHAEIRKRTNEFCGRMSGAHVRDNGRSIDTHDGLRLPRLSPSQQADDSCIVPPMILAS